MSTVQVSRPRRLRRTARWLRKRVLNEYMAGWWGGGAFAAFYFMHNWADGATFAVLWLATAIGTAKWGQS